MTIERIKFFRLKDSCGREIFPLDGEGFRIDHFYFDAFGRKLGYDLELIRYCEFLGCKFDINGFHVICRLSEDEYKGCLAVNFEILKTLNYGRK